MQFAIFTLGLVLLGIVAGQEPAPRRTPLGTQTPRPSTPPPRGQERPQPAAPAEAAMSAVQRAQNAHGGQTFKNILDSVAEGTLTVYRQGSPVAQYGLTVWRKGQSQVQRSIRSGAAEQRQGTNGTQSWDTFGGLRTSARGPALEFIETQTVRALPNLFEHQMRGARLRDDGLRGTDRVLTIEDSSGRTTTYAVNAVTSLVTRMEIVSGQAPDILGRQLSIVEAYVFSDFRTIEGVPTAFKIEHFTNGVKVDEVVFRSVRYNTGVSDAIFHP